MALTVIIMAETWNFFSQNFFSIFDTVGVLFHINIWLRCSFWLGGSLQVEFCCTNVGFDVFNFSGGLGLAGQECTATFTWYWSIREKRQQDKVGHYCLMSLLWWCHFVDGDILQSVIPGCLGILYVKAVRNHLKLGNSPPWPWFDWLGQILVPCWSVIMALVWVESSGQVHQKILVRICRLLLDKTCQFGSCHTDKVQELSLADSSRICGGVYSPPSSSLTTTQQKWAQMMCCVLFGLLVGSFSFFSFFFPFFSKY